MELRSHRFAQPGYLKRIIFSEIEPPLFSAML